MKYSANRCNLRDGSDIENKLFATKADCMKWAKKCRFYRVRSLKNREIVAKTF